jgi:ribonuclease E
MRDRARTRVLRISPFGLIEMTRQRIRPSLRRSVYENCPSCNGVGQVKTAESLSIEVMRLVLASAGHEKVAKIVIEVHDRVGNYLNNRKRKDLTRIEDENEITISIVARADVSFEHLAFRCDDENGREVTLE